MLPGPRSSYTLSSPIGCGVLEAGFRHKSGNTARWTLQVALSSTPKVVQWDSWAPSSSAHALVDSLVSSMTVISLLVLLLIKSLGCGFSGWHGIPSTWGVPLLSRVGGRFWQDTSAS